MPSSVILLQKSKFKVSLFTLLFTNLAEKFIISLSLMEVLQERSKFRAFKDSGIWKNDSILSGKLILYKIKTTLIYLREGFEVFRKKILP